jgi:hypothetical protein
MKKELTIDYALYIQERGELKERCFEDGASYVMRELEKANPAFATTKKKVIDWLCSFERSEGIPLSEFIATNKGTENEKEK